MHVFKKKGNIFLYFLKIYILLDNQLLTYNYFTHKLHLSQGIIEYLFKEIDITGKRLLPVVIFLQNEQHMMMYKTLWPTIVVLHPDPRDPRSADFACLPCLTHLIHIISSLGEISIS